MSASERPATRRVSMKPTKERLLDAAGEVFADKGFHAATVREICDKAQANLASINYHFGSKDKLYEAVVLHIFHYAMGKYPAVVDRDKALPPEDRLFAFVHRFLLRRLDKERPPWHAKILSREHAEPGPALQNAFKKLVRKNQEALHAIVRDLIGPAADEQDLRLCMSSVAGQCLYYHTGRPTMGQYGKHPDFSPAGIEKLARHITEFSIAAVRNMGRTKNVRRANGLRRAAP
jgi:AcrR family transcriptional regulator